MHKLTRKLTYKLMCKLVLVVYKLMCKLMYKLTHFVKLTTSSMLENATTTCKEGQQQIRSATRFDPVASHKSEEKPPIPILHNT